MKIQNIDISVELARKALDCVPFILDVISICKLCQVNAEQTIGGTLPIDPIWELITHSYDDVANMIHQIPIYLKKGPAKEGGIIDPLGAYFPVKEGNSPYIELYVNAIDEASEKDSQKFKWLFTKVLLHETMHAIMDVNNQVSFNGTPALIYQAGYVQWREESYANGGALWIIREYAKKVCTTEANDFVKYVERFMIMNQKEGYTLGAHVASFPSPYMRYWIDEKMTKSIQSEELLAWWKNIPKNKKTEFLNGNSPDFEHVKAIIEESEYDEHDNYKRLINQGRNCIFNIDDDIENSKNKTLIKEKIKPTSDEYQKKKEDLFKSSHKLKPLVEKLCNGGELTLDEKKTFQKCTSNNIDGQYVIYPHPIDTDIKLDKADLDELVKRSMEVFGESCNLNWIFVSRVKDLKGLFLHSKFNGNISQWDITDGSDCSYMFAFSEFCIWENLPESLRKELINPTGRIDTTGIFHGCKGEEDFIKIIAEERTKRGIQS